ncbi:hypothetical protein [Sabulicella rubraurantiaca]|uniref:hypothetical protein n=1 Tax=Sabulicella rubraurantiaca TaxID=2811429 RepID=UPI001A967DA4|nr:hypothetical protein [Sabulicella rubraurantiaca]
MTDRAPTAALVQAMAVQLRGETLSGQRATEVAADLRRLASHASAVAAENDFNAEPGQFAATLVHLAGGER